MVVECINCLISYCFELLKSFNYDVFYSDEICLSFIGLSLYIVFDK